MAKYEEWLTEEGLLQLEGWARDGLTMGDIAQNIGIARQRLYKWMEQYPDIKKAIKKGQKPVDIKVENALLKRALGYEYEETITEITTVGDKQQKHVRKFKKHMPPDVGAICFWLKNRKKDNWKDRPVSEGTKEDDALNKLLERLNDESAIEQETT